MRFSLEPKLTAMLHESTFLILVLDRELQKLGWIRSIIEPSLYTKGSLRLCAYVDDILLIGDTKSIRQERAAILEVLPGRAEEI